VVEHVERRIQFQRLKSLFVVIRQIYKELRSDIDYIQIRLVLSMQQHLLLFVLSAVRSFNEIIEIAIRIHILSAFPSFGLLRENHFAD
jgi:hypothetical protein